MQGSYNYFPHVTFLDSVEIENIGECCIEAATDLGEFYYLWITTSLGITKILEYGPYIDGIPANYAFCSFVSFQYSDSKIDKRIKKFLSDPAFTQVRVVDYNEIIENLVNLVEYMHGDY